MNRMFVFGVLACATVCRADMILVNRTSTVSIYSAPVGGDPLSDTRVWESLDDWVESVAGPLNAFATQSSFVTPQTLRFVGEGRGGGGPGLGFASGVSEMAVRFEIAESHGFDLDGVLGGFMGHSVVARLTRDGVVSVFDLASGAHDLSGMLTPGQYEYFVSVGGGQSGGGQGDLTLRVLVPAPGVMAVALGAMIIRGRRRDRAVPGLTYPPA